uniref:Uncharacterized protein n=1 Tax=Ascaris lumbricoides TaxID=6252 RepID=A0A0M3HZH2_ASCLU
MVRKPVPSVSADRSTDYSTVTKPVTTERPTTTTYTTSTVEAVDWGKGLFKTLQSSTEHGIDGPNDPQKKIAQGTVRRLTDYPTFDDVASDWDTDEDGNSKGKSECAKNNRQKKTAHQTETPNK